jgi:hypothetical protein
MVSIGFGMERERSLETRSLTEDLCSLAKPGLFLHCPPISVEPEAAGHKGPALLCLAAVENNRCHEDALKVCSALWSDCSLAFPDYKGEYSEKYTNL